MKFTHAQTKVVARLYLEYGVPVDQLPYTETIEQMLTDFAKQTGLTLTLREFYLGMINLRKAGSLGRLQKKRGK